MEYNIIQKQKHFGWEERVRKKELFRFYGLGGGVSVFVLWCAVEEEIFSLETFIELCTKYSKWSIKKNDLKTMVKLIPTRKKKIRNEAKSNIALYRICTLLDVIYFLNSYLLPAAENIVCSKTLGACLGWPDSIRSFGRINVYWLRLA